MTSARASGHQRLSYADVARGVTQASPHQSLSFDFRQFELHVLESIQRKRLGMSLRDSLRDAQRCLASEVHSSRSICPCANALHRLHVVWNDEGIRCPSDVLHRKVGIAHTLSDRQAPSLGVVPHTSEPCSSRVRVVCPCTSREND